MFSLFCFTADFLLFCSTTVKISLLGVRPSVFLLIPSISGISLKFLKDSKSYVFRQLVKQLVYSPLGEYNLVSFHFWWTEIVPRCAEKRNFFLWLSEKLPFSFNFCENSRKLKKRSVFSKKLKALHQYYPVSIGTVTICLLHIVRITVWHHLFLEFWLVNTWFCSVKAPTYWASPRGCTPLNTRRDKKLGFQLSHRQRLWVACWVLSHKFQAFQGFP